VDLVRALHGPSHVVAVELRPPRAQLDASAGMDAWIDTYHAVRQLTRSSRYVFLTDSAVGTEEEDNLRHLVLNLGSETPHSHVVPFLTAKHTLDYCLRYADRAHQHGFGSLVVLGGDTRVGVPRCLEHAWQLRQAIRARQPDLTLGGWANPHADPVRQVEYLLERDVTAEYFLTQVVSHHDLPAVSRFLDEAARRGLRLPGMFGVFYYRSANPRTLETLRAFLPVPAAGLGAEFAGGATAEEICARTVRSLVAAGVRHIYISNLPLARTEQTLRRILEGSQAPGA